MSDSPRSPLRGALIGCGFVSQHHVAGWKLVPDARLVALCDLDSTRLERVGPEVPEAKLFRDAATLFEQMPLDFVEICTRPESHRPLVELAARHGVHVLCQKPAALTRADLLAMIACCDRAGVRLMIHENWRFRTWYRAMKSALDAGVVGRPIRVRLNHRDTRALRHDGFADQPYFHAMPRLILLEMGCHLVDAARFLMGEVVSVSATLGQFGEGHSGEDVATLAVKFETGALGLLDMSWCGVPDVSRSEWALNETAVEGTEGTLRVETDGSLARIALDGTRERLAVAQPPDDRVYVEGYSATQAHFIDGLLNGKPHETSGAATLRTMDVVWAGYRSSDEGRTIVVNHPVDNRVPDRP